MATSSFISSLLSYNIIVDDNIEDEGKTGNKVHGCVMKSGRIAELQLEERLAAQPATYLRCILIFLHIHTLSSGCRIFFVLLKGYHG